MEKLKMIKDYKGNSSYRRSFNELAGLAFGIDFEVWYQKGGWKDSYVCYSFLDENRVVANVSINKMELIWEGRRKRALQVGTVMTHPDYRGRGLSSALMEAVLEEHLGNYDYIYLFAHSRAAGYYPRFGFVPLEESYFSTEFEGQGEGFSRLRKLDISRAKDYKTLLRLTADRAPVSQTLGVVKDQHLLLFYALYPFRDHLYLWQENQEETLIYGELGDSRVDLYDVVTPKPANLESLLAKILPPGNRKVAFHFTPDTDLASGGPPETGDVLFIQPEPRGLTRQFLFPATSRA